METWILFALISAVSGGLANFGVKMMVERGYNENYYAFYSNLISLVFFTFIMVLKGEFSDIVKGIGLMVAILGFSNMALLTISVNTRVASLQNIDTVIFYPLYKTLSPIIITCVSLLLFRETLSFNEALGIIVGISVPLLLITGHENKIQKNLYRGLVFMCLTAFLGSTASVMPKVAHTLSLNIDTFIWCAFATGVLFSWTILNFHKPKEEKKYIKAPYYFWCILGLFHFAGLYFFVHALTGNLAVVFTINSFSILVPIILSILFYGEHFNLKKGIVILLSIVSILLFI